MALIKNKEITSVDEDMENLILLVGMQNSVATVEDNLPVSKIAKYRITT